MPENNLPIGEAKPNSDEKPEISINIGGKPENNGGDLSFLEKARSFLGKKNGDEKAEKNSQPAKLTLLPDENLPINIFNQSALKTKDSKMVTTVIAQKDSVPKLKSILGSAPALAKTLEIEKEVIDKRKLRFRQIMLVAIFMVGLFLNGYFYKELTVNSAFGTNTIMRLKDVNSSLKQTQSNLNAYKYLAAQLQLNEFSYQADRFFGSIAKLNDPAYPAAKKTEIGSIIEETKNAIPDLLESVQATLLQDITVPIFVTPDETETTDEQVQNGFATDLRNSLLDERKKLMESTKNSGGSLSDLKVFDNAIRLVGNEKLFGTLKNISTEKLKQDLQDYQDTGDQQKLQKLQTLLSNILIATKSDLAVITDVKHTRIIWSSIIGQIDTETLKVDPDYGHPLLYDAKGGIVYTGYEFDTNTNKIVLSGNTKTFNAANFTVMSNLIDQLEASGFFQDVQMRSFSKSKSNGNSNDGYTASFKIDLRLETDRISDKTKPLSLQKTAQDSGVQRVIDKGEKAILAETQE